MSYKQPLIATLLTLASLGAARAAEVGQHPAVFAPRGQHDVEAATFIVGHPAAPVWRRDHANLAHPAVSNKTAAPRVDTDHYLVQPPASTQWRAEAAATLTQQPVVR